MSRASRSARPANGSIGSPPASGTAIALIVKSRVARSSSIVPAQRREVDRAARFEGDAPGAVALGERKRRTAGALRVGARGGLRLAAGDVEVDELAPEQLVAHGAADDPGLLAREHLPRELTHRSPTRRARVGLESMPVDELVVDRFRDARVLLERARRDRRA